MSEDITSLLKKFEAGELSQADLLCKYEEGMREKCSRRGGP